MRIRTLKLCIVSGRGRVQAGEVLEVPLPDAITLIRARQAEEWSEPAPDPDPLPHPAPAADEPELPLEDEEGEEEEAEEEAEAE